MQAVAADEAEAGRLLAHEHAYGGSVGLQRAVEAAKRRQRARPGLSFVFGSRRAVGGPTPKS